MLKVCESTTFFRKNKNKTVTANNTNIPNHSSGSTASNGAPGAPDLSLVVLGCGGWWLVVVGEIVHLLLSVPVTGHR